MRKLEDFFTGSLGFAQDDRENAGILNFAEQKGARRRVPLQFL